LHCKRILYYHSFSELNFRSIHFSRNAGSNIPEFPAFPSTSQNDGDFASGIVEGEAVVFGYDKSRFD